MLLFSCFSTWNNWLGARVRAVVVSLSIGAVDTTPPLSQAGTTASSTKRISPHQARVAMQVTSLTHGDGIDLRAGPLHSQAGALGEGEPNLGLAGHEGAEGPGQRIGAAHDGRAGRLGRVGGI